MLKKAKFFGAFGANYLGNPLSPVDDSCSAEASRRVFLCFIKIGGKGVQTFLLMDGMGRHFGHLRGRVFGNWTSKMA